MSDKIKNANAGAEVPAFGTAETVSVGTIVKLISGTYFVRHEGKITRCRARGKFRYTGEAPLVGDRVDFVEDAPGSGTVTKIHVRRNEFIRPPVANIDIMVIVASAVIPVTEPFLIDRMAAIATLADTEPVICINKCDLNAADELYDIYSRAGFRVFRVSAETGEGTEPLLQALIGKTSALTGNSGVGKSSILNALGLDLAVGEVSDRLGRGRHTTRHVEIHSVAVNVPDTVGAATENAAQGSILKVMNATEVADGEAVTTENATQGSILEVMNANSVAFIMDTPGFSSFDTSMMEQMDREALERAFFDFEPYLGQCRFRDCAHVKEPGCAVLGALADGKIVASRHKSYVRMLEAAIEMKSREYK